MVPQVTPSPPEGPARACTLGSTPASSRSTTGHTAVPLSTAPSTEAGSWGYKWVSEGWGSEGWACHGDPSGCQRDGRAMGIELDRQMSECDLDGPEWGGGRCLVPPSLSPSESSPSPLTINLQASCEPAYIPNMLNVMCSEMESVSRCVRPTQGLSWDKGRVEW